MKRIFLTNYRVKGIKTLNRTVSLSFFKKTITFPIDTEGYNIKGIYGMNGTGKSGIVTSIDILRNLLLDEDYLNNPMTQKSLEAIVNKETKELFIGAEFFWSTTETPLLYSYEVVLKKNLTGKYIIDSEKLLYKKANSKKEGFYPLLKVEKGELSEVHTDEVTKDFLIRKTVNLLSNATVSALLVKLIGANEIKEEVNPSFLRHIVATILFGGNIYAFIDRSDYHVDYFLSDMFNYSLDSVRDNSILELAYQSVFEMERNRLNAVSAGPNFIPKKQYNLFEKMVHKLQDFIKIFKLDLVRIDIDKKEDDEFYVCNLNMVYDSYTVNVEFESTGIKKLIALYAYLQKVVEGSIVFIDEFDSNLHDVYLCALIEYLMDYGEGQLCFTTHNIGPMDVLKQHKKSIDFLSIDKKIYPWVKNGNYSPSKLYKSGMIEGSPFNVDSIDFIGVFDQ